MRGNQCRGARLLITQLWMLMNVMAPGNGFVAELLGCRQGAIIQRERFCGS